MDPHSDAQDVPRCDLCETATVHNYCDFCHVNLCTPCIGKHISDGYDKHKIVPFQERRSTLIYPKCRIHQNKTCELQCKDCNIFVCLSCTASKQHKGHNFVEVTEVYNEKKEIIKKNTKELENHISPTYEEITLDLENQLANLDGGYEKITTAMSNQGEQWHREIDLVINKMKTEIGEIKVKHRDILKKHLDEIKQIQSLIKQTSLALRKIEKSTDISSTNEYSSMISEFRKCPPKVQVSLPTFIPKPIDRKQLYSWYGQITPLSTSTKENVLSLNQPNTSARELLDKPEHVATIQTGYGNLCSVSCLNEDKIWASGLARDIKCFNIKSWAPSQLCVTSTGDILVTMFSDDETQSKVGRYSGSTEKQSIQYDKEGKPLYSGNSGIKYITENRNHDICVADFEAGNVVVVNKAGELRWRYSGHPSVTKNKPFQLRGITRDSQRHILTTDWYNNCIHILDQDGQFLCYIDNCDLQGPFGLCVDDNDNLFVCECIKGNVKKIKYLR